MMDKIQFETKLALGDEGAFEGIASTFGGKPDRMGDTVVKGAFGQSITEHKANGTRPAFLWQHDPREPIGVIEAISEEAKGLKIKGRLVLESARAREAHALMKAGALNGLSIGFIARDFERHQMGRTLKEIDLQEISLVTFPANADARITNVKTAAMGAASSTKEKKMDNDTELKERTDAPENGVESTESKALVSDVDALKDQVRKLEAKASRPTVAASPTGEGDLEKKAFEKFIRHGAGSLGPDEVKSLTVSTDTDGGYLAPEQFENEILKDIVEFSPVRGAARVSQLSAQIAKIPSRDGRLTAQWVGEQDPRPETDVKYGQLSFEAYEIACYVDVSNQLLEDSAFNIASELSMDFAEEFGEKEGAAFVNGDGASKPKGFTTDPNVVEVISGTSGQVKADDVIDLYHSLKTAYASAGVWMMKRTTMGAIRKLKTTDGQYLLQMAGLNGAVATTLLGHPIIETPDLPEIAADAAPIWFGDFARGYRIWDRLNLQILRDPFTQATEGMVRFHARRRVGGGVTKAEALAKLTIKA